MVAKQKLEALRKLKDELKDDIPKREMFLSDIREKTNAVDRVRFAEAEQKYHKRLHDWIEELCVLLSFNPGYQNTVRKAGETVLSEATGEAFVAASESVGTVLYYAMAELESQIAESERVELLAAKQHRETLAQGDRHHAEEIVALRNANLVAKIGATISVLAMLATWGSVWYSRAQTQSAIDSSVDSAIRKLKSQSQANSGVPVQIPSPLPRASLTPLKEQPMSKPASAKPSLTPTS